MAGHSHWASIKHKKGVTDAKRGKLFSKLSRYIIIAARSGGGDPTTNLKLRYAIDKARSVSMPKDNIERAVKRGTGELAGDTIEELSYEGFGPGNVAILCEVLTDNRNRTLGEVRKIFERGGGNMGVAGCTAYLFDHKGVFTFPLNSASEDTLMTLALDAGADDVVKQSDHYEVTCVPIAFNGLQQAFEQAKLKPDVAELTRIGKALVDVDVETGQKVIRLMEALDDHDDIQNVYSTANLTEAMYAEA
jgi:YebC/PmpR family DNA-binding regulatory protein